MRIRVLPTRTDTELLWIELLVKDVSLLLASLDRQPSAPIEFLVSEPIQNSHLSFQQEWGRFVFVDVLVIRQTSISQLLGPKKPLEYCAFGLFLQELALPWQPRLNLLFVQILQSISATRTSRCATAFHAATRGQF